MRKLIKIGFNLGGLIGLILAMASMFLFTKLVVVMVFVGFVYSLFMMFSGIIMTNAGLDRDWFKTQEELQAAIEKENKARAHAEEVAKVLGKHEAVKYWEANKNEVK